MTRLWSSQVKFENKTDDKKIIKLKKQKDLIYDLRLENSKLKEENEKMKNQISDLSTALKSNKDLLIEMSDKFNAQLAINHKNLEKKIEQIRQIGREKDEIIEKLRSNFAMHMNALIFTCEKCGSSQFKTEIWKEGLDKTRFTSKVAGSDNAPSAIYGSNALKNHFESFWQWVGSSQKEKKDKSEIEEESEANKSLRTFRLVMTDSPNKNVPQSCLDQYEHDGSVIVRDVSPMQLRFTSENNEESKHTLLITF